MTPLPVLQILPQCVHWKGPGLPDIAAVPAIAGVAVASIVVVVALERRQNVRC